MIEKFNQFLNSHILQCISLLCIALTWLLYAPGSLSEDSLWQLYQARHGFVDIGNPPIMSLVWRYIDRYIVSGQGGMLFLMISMYWFGICFFVSAITEIRWFRLCGLLLIGFFPPVFGLVGVIWKDIFMLSVFYLSIGLFITWSFRKKKKLVSILLLALSVILLIICLLTRHNAMFAIFPIAFYYISVFIKNKMSSKLIIIIVLVVTMFSISTINNLQSFIYKKVIPGESNIWQYFMVYDLIGIEVNDNNYKIQSKLRNKIIRPGSEFSQLYTPELMAPLLFGKSEEKSVFNKKSFPTNDIEVLLLIKKEWLNAIINHPLAYAKHRSEFFLNQVGYCKSSLYAPIYFGVALDDNYEWGRDYSLKFKPHKIQVLWLNVLEKLTHTFLYSIYIYCIFLVCIFIIGIKWAIKYKDWFIISFSTSGILNTANFALLAISPDFRYNIWTISMFILSLFYIASKLINRYNSNYSITDSE